ncbi:DUF1501 domain-containing protein [Parafrankia sp. FMc2]|uniref:DUF1501 domain-containing protein n=1 Tax=Parafrankia sp. FMc2 TaxID=3233196 RepID=UPI0034D516BC
MDQNLLPPPGGRYAPSRRGVLAAAGAVGITASLASVLPVRVAFADTPGRTLVILSLRGGMDGLNALVPGADPNYAGLRADIAIPTGQLISMDRTFGLHPAYASLRPLLDAGKVAAVPAAGLLDNSRSHFQDTFELEIGGDGQGSGYLTRLLSVLSPGSAFRAVQEGGSLPTAYLGATEALTLNGIENFEASGWGESAAEQAATSTALGALFAGTDAARPYARGVATTLAALAEGREIAAKPYTPADGVTYPDEGLGRALQDIARLIKVGSGVRVATLETGGYDTHVGQGGVTGTLATLQKRQADSIAAFFADLGTKAADVTLVTIQEFGRRADTNGNGGTDHGGGGVMFVIGGGAVGGVHGQWRGLAPDQLDDHAVPVLNDYRNVLGDAIRWLGMSQAQLGTVFPGLTYTPVGVTAA